MIDSQIDCIVRFHDSTRLMELERCIFSLMGQTHPSLRIVLVTQRFSDSEMAAVVCAMAPLLSIQNAPELVIANWDKETPRDARTELLNLGLSSATGRYVAFLDYDDTLFPDAYATLLARLVHTEAAIAFATVRTVKADIYSEFVRIAGGFNAPFSGRNFIDLMRANFCPIHSYLIDRARLPPEVLSFDTSLVWEEDYDFLLRICACGIADFEALDHVIGDYYFKTDGSNSVWAHDVMSESKVAAYEQVSARIEMRRLLTRISPEVQRSLDSDGQIDPLLTIRSLLDRPAKPALLQNNMNIDIEKQPGLQREGGAHSAGSLVGLTTELNIRAARIAKLENELKRMHANLERVSAEHHREMDEIRRSTSWRVTRPMRWLKDRFQTLSGQRRHIYALAEKHGGFAPLLRRSFEIFGESGISGLRGHLRNSQKPKEDYLEWVRRYAALDEAGRVDLRNRVEGLVRKPLISIVMPTYNPNAVWLTAAIESVQAQIYPYWELCIADDASPDPSCLAMLGAWAAKDDRIKFTRRERNGHISAASNSALEMATGQWTALMDHDDLLSEDALFWVAHEIDANPCAKLIYSDEDKIDDKGIRFDPYFKSGWNPDLFYSQNMFSHLGVFETALLRQLGGFRLGLEGAQDYDLVLRCIEHVSPDQIRHIPKVLYHWRVHAESTASSTDAKPYAQIAGECALNQHFGRLGIAATVDHVGNGYRVHYALPSPAPLVSLIIPTRNAMELVRQCVESIDARTTYPNYEIILVDNGSDEPASLAYFAALAERPGVQVIRDDSPFNYSRLNNMAVDIARGELIALVNNDIEVITPEWLSEMVSLACQPGIGAVGARLWYPDGTLQHGGVVLGIGGVAGHAHKRLAHDRRGYFERAALVQSFSAVTAACLVVKKKHYLAVGGLNAQDLAVAFNDVDFCLRLRESGLRNVWTPYAELFHHESATRGDDIQPEKQARFAAEVQYMLRRWGDSLNHDPAYSPNLTLVHEDFSLAWPPLSVETRH